MTYKMEEKRKKELLQCWVVRFGPRVRNPWYNVSFCVRLYLISSVCYTVHMC